MQEHSDSAYLPNGKRDKVLRELALVLGFDFWALDEVQKEDVARELSFVFEEPAAEVKGERDALKDALDEWRERVCEIFGVSQQEGKMSVQVDKTDEEILDDIESERDTLHAWRDAYLGLREDMHAAVGLEDLGNPGEKNADGARDSETVVEHVREAHRAVAVALGRDPEKVSLGDLPGLVADLERRHRALTEANDGTTARVGGSLPRAFMGRLREAVGVARDITHDQILEAIGILREHAGRDDADERVERLERRLREREARIEKLEAQVERDAERVQELAQAARPAVETPVELPKAFEDALHVQVGRIRAENEALRREIEQSKSVVGAEIVPEPTIEREKAAEILPEFASEPKKEHMGALETQIEPKNAPATLDPDTVRALGLPPGTDPATIRARIESLLRAERDLEADFLAKGALL